MKGGGHSLDIALPDERVAMEVDGPYHFTGLADSVALCIALLGGLGAVQRELTGPALLLNCRCPIPSLTCSEHGARPPLAAGAHRSTQPPHPHPGLAADYSRLLDLVAPGGQQAAAGVAAATAGCGAAAKHRCVRRLTSSVFCTFVHTSYPWPLPTNQ